MKITTLGIAVILLLSGCSKPDLQAEARRYFEFRLGARPATLAHLREGRVVDADPSAFLAFDCEPGEMKKLIERNGFNHAKLKPLDGPRPQWWKLEELGPQPVLLVRDSPRAAEFMWASADYAKAYHLYHAY